MSTQLPQEQQALPLLGYYGNFGSSGSFRACYNVFTTVVGVGMLSLPQVRVELEYIETVVVFVTVSGFCCSCRCSCRCCLLLTTLTVGTKL